MPNEGLPFANSIKDQFRAAALLVGRVAPPQKDVSKKSCTQVATSVGPLALAPPKSCGLKPNRKRASPIKVRLSEIERGLVRQKAAKADLSVNAFIKTAILEAQYKPPIPREVHRELFRINRQLTGIATNINQMTKQLNGGATNAEEALRFLERITGPVLETLGIIRHTLGRNPAGPMP
ncbi:MAG: plasmid mobilization relaxosome protein MobC [Alphaproteobacteria bacterium]